MPIEINKLQLTWYQATAKVGKSLSFKESELTIDRADFVFESLIVKFFRRFLSLS